MGKKVFGGRDFRPTHPPTESEPVSRRHPGCWMCQGGGFFSVTKPPSFGTDVRVEIDSEPRGTNIEFICHGPVDPTKLIHVRVLLTDDPDLDDDADGEARPFRLIDVVSIDGADEEQDIAFTMIRGSADDPLAYERDGVAAPVIVPGRHLVFRAENGQDHVIRLPIAHITVRRP